MSDCCTLSREELFNIINECGLEHGEFRAKNGVIFSFNKEEDTATIISVVKIPLSTLETYKQC